jgi:ABC-type transport system involved in cytochrome c biogenesis ATPase subunit
MRRRREYFRIQRFVRRYDRVSGKFVFDVRYKTSVPLTGRTIAVAEAFGLGVDEDKEHVILDNVELKIGPKDIVYVTGDSGAGKSVLLRALKKDLGDDAIDIGDVHLDTSKPLIETVGKTVEVGLELLSKVGLNDAFLFLRKYSELSDGQKYRYRLAKLVESGKQWWLMDEFCATLDRDTAKILAFNVQKLARAQGKAVLAATTHTDLFEDLAPSVHIHKRFGKEIQVRYFPNSLNRECSLLREIKIEQGSLADYRVLAEFHYRSHRVGAVRKVFRAVRGEEICGVIVYTYPPICQPGRKQVLPRMSIQELNKKLSNIMRVVVHPKYRTIALGQRLIHETLCLAGTPFVETIAVMAKYNPFFEKAGMRKVWEVKAPENALKIRDALIKLGFDLTFLGSPKYVSTKLQSLNSADLQTVREVFQQNIIPRLMKEIFCRMPYVKQKLYRQELKTTPLEKLTRLINITALLLQTKIYLFWRNSYS